MNTHEPRERDPVYSLPLHPTDGAKSCEKNENKEEEKKRKGKRKREGNTRTDKKKRRKEKKGKKEKDLSTLVEEVIGKICLACRARRP